MAMSFSMILMIVVSGGGGSDLLDWMPTEDYWKAKNVAVSAETMLAELKPADTTGAPELIKKLGDAKAEVRDDATGKLRQMGAGIAPLLREAAKDPDAEVAARAELLLKEFGPSGKTNEIRRLMAIRALGELKAKDAAAALKGLAGSQEPFVADYAARALAAIEGKPLPRPRPSAADLQKDLWLLPKNCGVVAQAAPSFAQGLSINKIMESLGEAVPADQKDAARQKLVSMVQSVAEQVGNARLEAVTVGVADDVGNRTGYVVVVARGLYDPAAMKQAVISSSRRGSLAPQQVEGVEVISMSSDVALLMPSDERFVLMVGPKREMLPIAEMAKAIKAGKGELADNAEMVQLIKSADTAKPVWAAARITEAYAKAPFLAGFKTITLSADLKDDALEAKLLAQGSDANQVKENVASFEAILQEFKANGQRAVARTPALQPLLDLMESVKFQVDDVAVTGKASLKDPGKFLSTFPMMMLGMQVQARDRVQTIRAEKQNLPPR